MKCQGGQWFRVIWVVRMFVTVRTSRKSFCLFSAVVGRCDISAGLTHVLMDVDQWFFVPLDTQWGPHGPMAFPWRHTIMWLPLGIHMLLRWSRVTVLPDDNKQVAPLIGCYIVVAGRWGEYRMYVGDPIMIAVHVVAVPGVSEAAVVVFGDSGDCGDVRGGCVSDFIIIRGRTSIFTVVGAL